MKTEQMIPEYPKLSASQDRRRKIPKEEHEYIRTLYNKEGHSQRTIARLYGVSRRLITFILHPERERIQKDRVIAEKRWNKYYTKEKWRDYMRVHRKHKHALQDVEVKAHRNATRSKPCPICGLMRSNIKGRLLAIHKSKL